MKAPRLRLFILLLTGCALGLSGVAFAAAPPTDAHPQLATTEEPQIVRVRVTDKGFDQKDLQVRLEQGKPVELKFEFDQSFADAHIFEIAGYGLRTESLDQTNREVSVKFVPTQIGSVVFFCTLDCEVHHFLQDGRLSIVPPGAGGASVVEAPTALTVASLQQTSAGEPIILWATLRDSGGQPIGGAPVRFYVATELFPDHPVLAGTETTDSQGQAKLVYVPRANGALTVQAKFEGGGIYKTSDASYSLQVSNAQPAYVEAPKGLEAIARWAPPTVMAVVLAIWSIYAIVVYQIFRIARSKGSVT